ncbi:MAG TPA: tetratricopeptide repeat protein [Dongiaceae bacterium]|nr:tetratricopeptide repeat protein [Dongiaceae bacterium]
MRRIPAILAAVIALGLGLGPLHAPADQTDPRLKALFESLRSASSPEAAADVESQIWAIWVQSGDPSLDQVFQLGSQAMAVGDTNTALKIFDAIVQKAPNFAEGWNKRATIYYMMGNYEASLADIDRTLELEPHHFGALAGLGLVNIGLDRDEAALDAFERVLKVDPQSQSARQNIEFVKQRIKDKSI